MSEPLGGGATEAKAWTEEEHSGLEDWGQVVQRRVGQEPGEEAGVRAWMALTREVTSVDF